MKRRKIMADLPALTVAGEPITLAEAAVQALQGALHGELLCAGDNDYEEVRRVWNAMIDKRPTLIARCQDAADVIAAVNFARNHRLLVAVRGGGHNVAGLAVCDGGLMIDLSPMRGVWVDPVARTAQVQGGATWRDVDYETQAFGLAVPGGVVSSTGVAGYTLGGGYGWLRSKYGLTCDSLRAVDVVTADGRLLRASADRHADLFWGVQGGGGNYGVVTSFEFQLYPVGPQVVLCAPIYPAAEAPRIYRAWRDFMAGAPEEFSCDADLWTFPAHPAYPPALWNKDVILLPGVYCGPLEAGEALIEPLRRLGEPLLDLSGRWPYLQVQQAFDPLFRKGEFAHYWKSLYVDRLDDAAIDLIFEHYLTRPSPRTLIPIRHLGGATHRAPNAAAALSERSAPFLVSIDSTWQEPEETDANIAWTRAFWAALQPYSSGKLYFNFPGLLEEGDALVRATFGANYERLVALKNKYDPTNLFRLNQNIKPTAREERGL
jgi:FAD/FMN-containing dehydrogenase